MRKWIWAVLILVEIIMLFPLGVIAMFAGMAFASPGSQSNPLNWWIVYSAIYYCFISVCCLFYALLNRKHGRRVWISLALPLIPLLTFWISILLSELLCGGQTVCTPF